MILGIETSGEMASVALFREGRVVGESSFESRMKLNQRLASELRELLGADLPSIGLEIIAAGVGPGSFTGVRMGVALAKALAHGLSLPLAGVSAPEAVVSGLRLTEGTKVCVLQRARADEVYTTAIVVEGKGIPAERAATQVITIDAALRAVQQLLEGPPSIVVGNAAERFADRIDAAFPAVEIIADERALPKAGEVARVAARRPEAAERGLAFSLVPRYVRLSQAEREFGVDLGLSGGGHG